MTDHDWQDLAEERGAEMKALREKVARLEGAIKEAAPVVAEAIILQRENAALRAEIDQARGTHLIRDSALLRMRRGEGDPAPTPRSAPAPPAAHPAPPAAPE